MVAYMKEGMRARQYEMHAHDYTKLYTIVEKIYPEHEITLLYQFHAQNALFKVPKT